MTKGTNSELILEKFNDLTILLAKETGERFFIAIAIMKDKSVLTNLASGKENNRAELADILLILSQRIYEGFNPAK